MINRQTLGHLRCLLLEIDDVGNIVDAVGALDTVAGYTAAEMAGQNVFDFIAERDREMLVQIFLPTIDDIPVNPRAVPFELTLAAPDGSLEPVDVLPTGYRTESGRGWIVAMTPRSLRSPAHRLVDRVIANEGVRSVASELVESMSLRVLHDPTQAWVRAFVVMGVGSGEMEVVSTGLDPDVDEALLDPEVIAGFERDAVPGEIQSTLVDELAEPLRSTARRAGYRAVHVGSASDGEQIAWWVVWLINDPAYALKMVNADLPRLAALRVADHALERARIEAMLRRAASTDAVTGLGNRSYFTASLEAATASPTDCVLYIDLDSFKSINDSHGHDVGDDVLAEVGRRIAAVCRGGDVTARIGGDEFAVLLPDTSPTIAEAIAQRLAEAIAQPMSLSVGDAQVEATIGVAWTGGDVGLEGVVRKADLQMLELKRGRRTLGETG